MGRRPQRAGGGGRGVAAAGGGDPPYGDSAGGDSAIGPPPAPAGRAAAAVTLRRTSVHRPSSHRSSAAVEGAIEARERLALSCSRSRLWTARSRSWWRVHRGPSSFAAAVRHIRPHPARLTPPSTDNFNGPQKPVTAKPDHGPNSTSNILCIHSSTVALDKKRLGCSRRHPRKTLFHVITQLLRSCRPAAAVRTRPPPEDHRTRLTWLAAPQFEQQTGSGQSAPACRSGGGTDRDTQRATPGRLSGSEGACDAGDAAHQVPSRRLGVLLSVNRRGAYAPTQSGGGRRQGRVLCRHGPPTASGAAASGPVERRCRRRLHIRTFEQRLPAPPLLSAAHHRDARDRRERCVVCTCRLRWVDARIISFSILEPVAGRSLRAGSWCA
jgi:hypothetical protein